MSLSTRALAKRGARAFRVTRSGTVHDNAVDIENAAASALAGLSTGATFATITTDAGLEHWLVTDDRTSQESATKMAACILANTLDTRCFVRAFGPRQAPFQPVHHRNI